MSWLHGLLTALNEEELLQLNKLRLIGKEREVLNALLRYTCDEIPSPEEICSQLQITQSHYYKINSILLDKLYAHFVPQGSYELLLWLRRKELYPILKNEIKDQLKGKHASPYYLNLFRMLIDLPYKFYDDRLTKEVGNAYLGALEKRSLSDDKYVTFHLLFADCNRYAASKNPAKKFGYSEADLLKMENELTSSEHFLARYYLYRTLCNFYKYYRKDAVLSLSYLEKAIQLKDKIAEFFPINIHQFLRLLYADALLGFNNEQAAFDLYQEVFKEGIDQAMYGFYYHCEQYAISAILLKKYEKAEELAATYFDDCIHKKNDIYATRGALTYAKLYLSIGEFKKALQYIQLGMEINEKSFYLPFEIQLRALENIYFFFQGDFDFAKQLSLRNTKYIINQKSEELHKNYRHFFKMIAALINCIEQRKELSASLQVECKSIHDQLRNLYCDLIPMMQARLMKKRI
ncbi:MAG: hypothetical protein IPP32_07705 [Bacteroidetes bacterium]|nr:hypothetical protein [Bacteroidota bacterium]